MPMHLKCRVNLHSTDIYKKLAIEFKNNILKVAALEQTINFLKYRRNKKYNVFKQA